jgi:phosphonoacetaldehyde hydrolase
VKDREKLAAVIFDWAGTTVDHGSLAPVRVLLHLFESHGVPISEGEARRDMGVLKRDHILKIMSAPAVSERWRAQKGNEPNEQDVAGMFAEFVPLQLECLIRDSPIIDGVVETTSKLKARGLKIGSSTGYTREMMDLLAPAAAKNGYRPDSIVTPDDVGGGRPHPWMIFASAIQLQIDNLARIVKIGDTVSDVEEGLNAGVWTIGVARTGNLVGMRASDFAALAPHEQHAKLDRAHAQLRDAGAHGVIDSVAECLPALDQIEHWICEGRTPSRAM